MGDIEAKRSYPKYFHYIAEILLGYKTMRISIHSVSLRLIICLFSWLFFVALSPQESYAQRDQRGQRQGAIRNPAYNPNSTADKYGDLSQIGANPFEGEDEEGDERSDSTKKPKIRKPLESYLFDDSTRKRPNFSWNIDTYLNRVELKDIDTAMLEFQLDYPFHRKGVGDAIQGNLGGAGYPLNYFDRAQYRDFNFAQPYDIYMFSPTNVRFYNVKKPFSIFGYMTAGQKMREENNLTIIHAQNISPSTGFNISYNSRGTRGLYMWQKGRAKNLSVAFSHTGKKYTIHAGYIYNAEINKENGGLRDDRDFTDSLIELPENLQMRLHDAQNTIKNNTYYVTQSYGIPLRKLTDDDFSIADQSTIFVGHTFEYKRWHKNYIDTRGVSDPDYPDYYDNWYIDPKATHDSIYESLISNRIFIQLQPWNRDGAIGTIDAGVGMDNHLYYQARAEDLLGGISSGDKKTSYYIYGAIDGKIKRYVSWGASAKITPMGYRNGDMNIDGYLSISAFIRGKPLTFAAKISHDRRSADYWSEELFSNHYVWSNSFSRENQTRIDASFTVPSIGLELGAGHSMVGNRVYYNELRQPTQHSGNVNVTGVYLRKDFRAGGFNFNHRVLVQHSSAESIIPVPKLSAFVSYFFEFNIVKNVLRAQFGIDGRFNTKYYAHGWNPATTTFYNQQEKKVGGYPMVDVFFNAKWKRMRILLKVQHLNENMIGRTYFGLPHYPLNKRLFKLGFSWSFYD